MKNKVILLISTEAWGVNFVSKHHYANHLSQNNTVYFLNPITNSVLNPIGNTNVLINEIKEGLYEVNYRNLLPKLNSTPKFIQNLIYKRQAKQIQNAIGLKKIDIVWSFDPYRFWNQNNWKAKEKIYHTVDFHPNASFEVDMIKSSDISLTVSKHIPSIELNEKYSMKVVSHGYKVSKERSDSHVELPGFNSVRAIYVGNVGSLLDQGRLNELAKSNPNVDFILLGPTGKSNLSSSGKKQINNFEKNVYFIGEKPANSIDLYLEKCDINLLPLVQRDGVKNINSHKLMYYFYSGNATVSDWLMDFDDSKEGLLYMTKSADEFLLKMKDVVENLIIYNSKYLKEMRKEFAINNSYDEKIKYISSLIK